MKLNIYYANKQQLTKSLVKNQIWLYEFNEILQRSNHCNT